MTTVYFVRHAEPDFNVHDDFSRPLTEKGRRDCALVTEFLRDKGIDAVLSSPYVRARDTVAPFAAAAGLTVREIAGFRERKVADEWILPFEDFTSKQWADFSYKLENGESLEEVTARNIAALCDVLREYRGKTIAIGGHGTAISTVVHYFDNTYGYEGFSAMKRSFPWIVKMEFGDRAECAAATGESGESGLRVPDFPFACASMEKIDLFTPAVPDYSNPEVRCVPPDTLGAYKYTVIFARYKEKWLYCRHRKRGTYETAGGRIEAGETPLEAARRELFEETGAAEFDIEAAFDYSVHLPCRYSNGQVFFARVHRLGEMPDFEMAEVGLFNGVPEAMTYPKILPVLYRYLQGWLNIRTAPDEIWDVYDAERRLTGRTQRRIGPKQPDDFFLVVGAWLLNPRGEFLITKRAPTKGFPLLWETVGGSAVAGDDSLTAAIREVKEETGLTVHPENGELLFTYMGSHAFCDIWLFRDNFDLRDVVLQAGETVDARFATLDEIREMIRTGEFMPIEYFEELCGFI